MPNCGEAAVTCKTPSSKSTRRFALLPLNDERSERGLHQNLNPPLLQNLKPTYCSHNGVARPASGAFAVNVQPVQPEDISRCIYSITFGVQRPHPLQFTVCLPCVWKALEGAHVSGILDFGVGTEVGTKMVMHLGKLSCAMRLSDTDQALV